MKTNLVLVKAALLLCIGCIKKDCPPACISITKLSLSGLQNADGTTAWDGGASGSRPDLVWRVELKGVTIYRSSDTIQNFQSGDALIYDLTNNPVRMPIEKVEKGKNDMYYHTYHLILEDVDGIDGTDNNEEGALIMDMHFIPWTGSMWEKPQLVLEENGVNAVMDVIYN